jgi:hypothetical protein
MVFVIINYNMNVDKNVLFAIGITLIVCVILSHSVEHVIFKIDTTEKQNSSHNMATMILHVAMALVGGGVLVWGMIRAGKE